MKSIQILSLAAAILLVGSLAISPAAEAEIVHATKMKFKNNGAYDATPMVAYHWKPGRTCFLYLRSTKIGQGESKTIDLTKKSFVLNTVHSHWKCNDDGKIPLKKDIWGAFDIAMGERKSCRKSKRLRRGDSGTISYRAGGTTLINNRCKVSKWP